MTLRSVTQRLFLLIAFASLAQAAYGQPVATDEARAVARDASIYGFPLVDGYRIMHAYFVDPKNPEYKAPFNALRNMPRVYTPEDRAVQAPNSDTPYSMLGMDLRAEPIVLTVPAIPKDRYYSIQQVDAYTFNFAYLGSRTTGNEAGTFLVAGPGWKGQPPAGIRKVFQDASKHRYVLRFGPGQHPPVNAFWSLTMYELPETLLVANRLNRYLINSPMLPSLKRDADGGVTICLQGNRPVRTRNPTGCPPRMGRSLRSCVSTGRRTRPRMDAGRIRHCRGLSRPNDARTACGEVCGRPSGTLLEPE